MPKIFLLDGPAGSGKSTLTPILLKHFGSKIHHCKRVTTRPQRPDDKNYFYVDQVEFGKYLGEDELAAYRTFKNGYSYGVRRTPVEEAVKNGHHVFSLMDLGTAEMARRVWPDCVTIFLMAPLEMLEKRLYEKKAHTEEQIQEVVTETIRKMPKIHSTMTLTRSESGELFQASEKLIGAMLGQNLIQAYVVIHCVKGEEYTTLKNLSHIPEVKEADVIFGLYDVICKVEASNNTILDNVITKAIRKLPHIISSVTLHVVKEQEY